VQKEAGIAWNHPAVFPVCLGSKGDTIGGGMGYRINQILLPKNSPVFKKIQPKNTIVLRKIQGKNRLNLKKIQP